jgi:hypothetical protein
VGYRALVVAAVASSMVGLASAPCAAQMRCAPDPSLTEPARGPVLPTEPVSALGLVDPGARFAYIRGVLDEDARRARTWTTAWAIAGTVFIAGNAAYAAITTDDAMRVDAIIEAVKSIFIPAVLIVQPIHAMRSAPEVDALGRAFEWAPGRVATCVPLARAEELLVDAAEDEAFATGWLAHTVVIVGNLAVSAVQGFGLGHWVGAALGVGGGIGIGELQILTHPTLALDALGPYSKGHLGTGPAPLAWTVVPFAPPRPPFGGAAAPAWGASLAATF